METLLKYAHELVMFMAVATSMGGTILLFKLGKTDNVPALKAAFGLAIPTVKSISPQYGVGTLLGLVTAWVMGYNLLATWLVAAYVLTLISAVFGGMSTRWVLKVATLAETNVGDTPSPELKKALTDPFIRNLRILDSVFLVLFLALMVFRPSLW